MNRLANIRSSNDRMFVFPSSALLVLTNSLNRPPKMTSLPPILSMFLCLFSIKRSHINDSVDKIEIGFVPMLSVYRRLSVCLSLYLSFFYSKKKELASLIHSILNLKKLNG